MSPGEHAQTPACAAAVSASLDACGASEYIGREAVLALSVFLSTAASWVLTEWRARRAARHAHEAALRAHVAAPPPAPTWASAPLRNGDTP